MPFVLPDFDTIDRKDIEGTHELLKLRRRGILALVLAQKEAQSGAVFGGHNWENLGQHPSVVEEYYQSINTRADFVKYSTKIRRGLQDLIETRKI